MMKKSPLAPKKITKLSPIDGIAFATASTGMKYKGRDDLLLVSFDCGAVVAGVFTSSKCSSAPVEWCRQILASNNLAQAVLVNAGNANAFTGKEGFEAMTSTIDAVSTSLECKPGAVYVASTGVIGEVLDAQSINKHVKIAAKNLKQDHWHEAAKAILTTDTFEKTATRSARVADQTVTINGFAKGSGMIAPDMATMLSFIFTDAAIDQKTLQRILKDACDQSFNCITVDSDTSTSDTLLAFATGKDSIITDINNSILDDFKRAFNEVTLDLAHQIVRDGEGASKFITIDVSGAENDSAAKKIAMSIANSPLVKTAIAGEDANWGRIVMAVGKAGERAQRDHLIIRIGGQKVTENGHRIEGYDESKCNAHLKGTDIEITVDVGVADGKAKVWTCDLTHDYININADYRS